MCQNNFLRQETFLKDISEKLSSDQGNEVILKLQELRSSLLGDNKVRFYLCSDLERLHECMDDKALDSIWLKYFPSSIKINCANETLKVEQTSRMKKSVNYDTMIREDCRVFTSMPRNDFIISLGTSDSSYLRLVSSNDVDVYNHPNYAGLLVLIEYFSQTEVTNYKYEFDWKNYNFFEFNRGHFGKQLEDQDIVIINPCILTLKPLNLKYV